MACTVLLDLHRLIVSDSDTACAGGGITVSCAPMQLFARLEAEKELHIKERLERHLQNRGERGKEKVTDETVVPVETRLAGIEAMLAEQQKLLLQLLAAQQQQGGRASGLVAGRVDV